MNRILTVEAARGIAALLVVIFHANVSARFIEAQHFPILAFGEHGVDFFFVLSGFIIFHVHGRDIGKPEMAGGFIRKRALRIFPLLWIVVLANAALKALTGDEIDWATLATSLLLVPSDTLPSPVIVWTLRFEMLFYAGFLVWILNRRAGLVLTAVWALGVVAQSVMTVAGHPLQGVWSMLLSGFLWDFLLGVAIGRWSAGRKIVPSAATLFFALAFASALLFLDLALDLKRLGPDDYASIPAMFWTPILGLGFGAILIGLLRIESLVRVPRWMLSLGAASYAIYLVHTPANAAIQHVAKLLPFPGAPQLAMIAVGLAAGFAAHFLIEKPLTKRLSRFRHGPAAAGSAHPEKAQPPLRR